MRKLIPLLILPTLLVYFAPTLLAQQASEPERRYSLFSKPDVEPKDREQEITLETEFKTSITIPGIEFVPCQAAVELAYSQRNTIARVAATVSNAQCDVVDGSFEIVASVRGDDGELVRHVFPETFSLDGVNEIELSRDYPIGENVTLSSVRTRRVECECLIDNTD